MRYRLEEDGFKKVIPGYDFLSSINEELKTYQVWRENWFGSWKCIKTFITLEEAKNFIKQITKDKKS